MQRAVFGKIRLHRLDCMYGMVFPPTSILAGDTLLSDKSGKVCTRRLYRLIVCKYLLDTMSGRVFDFHENGKSETTLDIAAHLVVRIG